LIIGGGISGISASLSAAREGSTVCLVESNNELGGSIGENSQMPLDYASSCNDPFFRESGIFEEITTNLRLGNKEGTFTGQARALLNLVKTEPNITTMLGCQCLEVTPNSSEDRIDSCTIIDHLNYCKFLHRAEYFVDCSNGGEFSKLANVPGESGNPANTEPRKTVQNLFKSEVLIEIARSQNNLPFQCPDWINIRWENNLHLSRLSLMKSLEQQLCGFHRLEWISEDSNSPTPHELCWATWDFIKNRSNFKEVSQRLFIKRIITLHPNQSLFRGIGDYILKEEDLVQGNSFEDSVAVSRAPIRAINPSSTSSSKQIVLPDSFEIPLRALYSTKIKNLLWAGSHASCEPVVSASLAHPPTLSLMGSAAGHCAARCIIDKRLPRTLSKSGHIEKLRRELEKKNHRTGKLLPHDENNLTTTARVYASTIWQDKNLLELMRAPGMETDACLVQFPVTSGRIDTIKLLIDCHANQRVDARLLEGSAQNPHIQGSCLGTDSFDSGKSGEQWVIFHFNKEFKKNGWYFLELRSNQDFKITEGVHAPVGHLVQYPRKKCGISIDNPYSEYSVATAFTPHPHRCAIIEIEPSQKSYDASEMIAENSRPTKLPGLWISQPSQFSYPEFVEFHWSNPVTISRIDIFFDPSFGYCTQPEPSFSGDEHAISLVKNYRIYFTNKDGKAKLVDEIKENTSAHQVHLFDACTIKSMEIEILSTHGLDRAQVFRVAAYE
jgi:hypothetical protein